MRRRRRWVTCNRSFIAHSYACLEGRGSHHAVLRFMDGMRRYRHVMQLDAARCFYSIGHGILRAVLFRRLPERPLRAVLGRIIEAGDGLDHHACRVMRVAVYQRYMDDISFFGDDRGALVAARDEIAGWLAAERGLALKVADERPRRTDGRVGYLGFTVSRAGVVAGARARAVLAGRVRAAAAGSGLSASLAALRSHWLFGSPEG